MNIVLYVEGGGDKADQRAELRRAFTGLLKPQIDAARDRGHGFQIIPCGGRQKTYDKFTSFRDFDSVALLLVDSEGPVACAADHGADAPHRANHLNGRDGWQIEDRDAANVHLMVQTMETWVVADPGGLENYYGAGFNRGQLPQRQNLEEHPKNDVARDLDNATRPSKKGRYHKINHIRGIFQSMDQGMIEQKCRRFAFLTARIEELLR